MKLSQNGQTHHLRAQFASYRPLPWIDLILRKQFCGRAAALPMGVSYLCHMPLQSRAPSKGTTALPSASVQCLLESHFLFQAARRVMSPNGGTVN